MRASVVTFSRTPLVILMFVFLVVFYGTVPAQDAAVPQHSVASTNSVPLITQPVNESLLTRLRGNTHPLARPEFDLGSAPADLPMQRMLLVLKRSPDQESALGKLLDDQQDKSSANYHQWLTPEQFGQQFGPTDSDIHTVTGWLQSHGFQVSTVAKGRNIVEFSGSASQVQAAFHTAIHKYIVNGEQHWANSSDPEIPSALTPVVAGIHTLHNFLKKPMLHFSGQKVAGQYVPGKPPQVTFSNGTHALVPSDYATIYNSNPLYNATPPNTGGGADIAVVARSDLFNQGEDIYTFISLFGIPASPGGALYLAINGPDPGDLGGGDEAEATLDVIWAGAIAPDAGINFVASASTNTTDGVDLSEFFIIDRNFAGIMTESFGTCEADVTSTQAQGISTLAQQAAAQGITYLVSSGDSGAEGCDDPNSETIAAGPVSVNALASSPYIVAVGGTMFNENGQDSKYWNPGNGFITGSAISYIPENVWNESCSATQCSQNANIWAGGGGASTLFAKPSWQSGVSGIPNDNARDLPDVSLTAAGHDPYLICLEGSCTPNAQNQIFVYLVSGTSAAAPSFAGVIALVDTMQAQLTNLSGVRQGEASYILYKLAAKETLTQCNASSTTGMPASTCIFNDVTSGNNAVPGELNYDTTTAQYQSGVGYDLATGLGSINIANLVNSWDSVSFQPTTTTIVNLSPTTFTHGQPVNFDITVTSSSGTPTGSISLVASDQVGGRQSVGVFPLTGGSFIGQVSSIPAPLFNGFEYITAEYGGDGTFAGSSSNESTQLTVNPEPSTTTLSAATLALSGSSLTLVPLGASATYGNMVYLRADVAGLSRIGNPAGTVTFTDASGDPPIPGNPYPLNTQGTAVTPVGLFTLPVGQYSVTANYGSDFSFNASTSSPLTFIISPAATTSTIVSSASTIASGGSVTLTASIATGTSTAPSFGGAPTGTVSFFANGTLLGTAQPVVGTAGVANFLAGPFTPPSATATLITTALPTGSDSITATYTGDSNYATSTSTAIVVTAQPDFSFPASGLGTVTISAPGGTGTVNLSITPGTGFNAAVTFTCLASSLPAEAKCSQGTIPAGQTTGAMTVTTTASHALLQPNRYRYYVAWWAVGGTIPLVGLFLIAAPRRSMTVPFLLVFGLLLLLLGCGGSSSGSGGSHDPGTPPGTYTVTVTATSGSLSHSTTFSLVVQ